MYQDRAVPGPGGERVVVVVYAYAKMFEEVRANDSHADISHYEVERVLNAADLDGPLPFAECFQRIAVDCFQPDGGIRCAIPPLSCSGRFQTEHRTAVD